MKKREIKRGYLPLCVLMASILLMSLIVRPLADIDNPETSVTDNQLLEDETLSDAEETDGDAEVTDGDEEVTDGDAEETDGDAEETGGDEEEPDGDEEETDGDEEVTDGDEEVTDGDEEEPDGDEEEPDGDEEATDSDAEETDGDAEETGGDEEEPDEEKVDGEDEEKEAPKRTEYVYQDDDIIVTAVLSEAEAVPDDAELYVIPITHNTDSEQYSTVEAKVNESIEAENQTLVSLLAYDIFFMSDGARLEPELGFVTVTINYKHEIFNEVIDEIRVLHLEETCSGIQVEDVTRVVGVTAAGVTAETYVNAQAASALGGDDTAEFVTDSFSTFVVTGVNTGSGTEINVTMNFFTDTGVVDTSIGGTYYLYVSCSNYDGYNSYRNTLELDVVSGAASAELTGLYDQNGQMNGGSLYPLINSTGNKVYTAILFKNNGTDTVRLDGSFRWDENNYIAHHIEKYELTSEIEDDYTVTEYPSVIQVTNGSGLMTITASAKQGTNFSSSYILGALSPVRPYAVFAKQFDLVCDMEGSIAVEKTNIYGGNFGNSTNNTGSYYCSTIKTITVHKTYNGTTQKTFTFGLYRQGVLVDTATIVLPAAGGNQTGTASFCSLNPASTYSVFELGENNTQLAEGDNYNGFTLTSQNSSTNTANSTINNTSYIDTILSCCNQTVLRGSPNVQNRLVLGPTYAVVSENSKKCAYIGTSRLLYIDDANGEIVSAGGNYPMPDFDGTLSQMAGLSASLATAAPSDTVMVKNMTIAELNSKVLGELTFNTNGRILLLNIDATGASSISLRASAPFIVNGAVCAGWSAQANNIVINIYTKSGGSYSAYTGSITEAGFVFGTLLAPCARVNGLSQNFNGNIVAAYVTNAGGEIHGNTMGTAIVETVYEFVNTATLGIVLPETGGIGTHVYYDLGGGIVLLAAIPMIVCKFGGKRKRKVKRKRR